jgi:hypothetical protein
MGLMLGLPELLRAGAASGLRGLTPPGQGTAREKTDRSCIFVYQYGGASHIDSWDLKPLAPAEYRGPYKPIATSVPGVQICELMPRLAQLVHRYCLIRSMTHDVPDHEPGMHLCLSGQSRPPADAPYFGSVLSRLNPARRNVPSYVWIQEWDPLFGVKHHGGGFLGPAHAPLVIGQAATCFATPGFRVTAFDPPAGHSRADVSRRHQLLQHLETAPATPAATAADNRFLQFRQRAYDLVSSAEARGVFDLEREPVQVRDRYGRHPLGQNLLAARRLVEAGVRLVSVTAFMGHHPKEDYTVLQTWDMHGAGGPGIFGDGGFGMPWALSRLDEAVSALLEDLGQRGLLESTLVVVVGEFGRTPKINTKPGGGGTGVGRDHWPACYSALLAGAGVRGGAVYGASDNLAAYVKDHPVPPERFAATLFHALGVPPEARLSPDGFARPAGTGQPIRELFA